MWSLISDRRSNQQQARQSFSQTESEQMSFEMTSFTSSKPSPHFHPRLHETRFILLILAIVLAIVTVFDAVFGLKFSDFNVSNVFCDDFEFELEYDCDTIDAICAAENTQASAFEFNDTSSGIRDFNINKRVFALVFNEYEFNNEITNMIDIYFNDNVLDSTRSLFSETDALNYILSISSYILADCVAVASNALNSVGLILDLREKRFSYCSI